MRIKQIEVNNLFNRFNHIIPLNNEERMTIIHGPNGFGKTIMLKILYGLFTGKLNEITSIPFDSYIILFTSDETLSIIKTEIESSDSIQTTLFEESKFQEDLEIKKKQAKTYEVNIAFDSKSGKKKFELTNNNLPSTRMLESLIPYIERINPREFIDQNIGDVINVEEAYFRYSDYLPKEYRANQPDWFKQLQRDIDFTFIETQRLLDIEAINLERRYKSKNRQKSLSTVSQFALELKDIIDNKLRESATLSQSLDSTFPFRLVNELQKKSEEKPQSALQNKLEALEAKRNKLKEVGLSKKEDNIFFQDLTNQLPKETREILDFLIKDYEEKLSFFDETEQKISLFKEIINHRFTYKKIQISNENGFHFIDEDKELVYLNSLSSGEQHELVLIFQLLFKVRSGSYVLIDEPELSLHVSWQKQFLNDLAKITKLSSFDVIIATHSPQIIHDRWDMTVELTGPVIE